MEKEIYKFWKIDHIIPVLEVARFKSSYKLNCVTPTGQKPKDKLSTEN